MSRKKYSEQFKIQVVKQVLEEGKTISNISMDLEISRNMIYRWIKEYELHGEEAFVGHGNNRKNIDFEIKKLKDKVKELEIECEILKKYSAFLSEQNKKNLNS